MPWIIDPDEGLINDQGQKPLGPEGFIYQGPDPWNASYIWQCAACGWIAFAESATEPPSECFFCEN